MKQGLRFFEKLLAFSILFLIPTQLALHFWPAYSFVFGIRVDYLSPAVYLTDVLVFLLLVTFLINDGKEFGKFLTSNRKYFFALLILVIVNTVFSNLPSVTVYKWIKICEAIFFGIYVYIRKNYLGETSLLKTVFASGVFFSLIGILQFLLEKTTGAFYLIGERTFTILTPGIALFSFNGREYLRAYSTFPHPNALAGFLGTVLIINLFGNYLKNSKRHLIGLLIIASSFLLTMSLSAFIAFTLTVLFLIIFKKHDLKIMARIVVFLGLLFSLLLPLFSKTILANFALDKNVSERLQLSYISGKMISEKFFFGEGLNTFTAISPRFFGTSSFVWLLQPVHNIFLLTFVETGLVGLIFLVFIFFKLINKSLLKGTVFIGVFLFIILTGLNDHYWLTLQQNLLFLPTILALMVNF